MTDKELKKLSRTDLMEMLLEVTRENEQLRQELAETRQQLDSKIIAVENAGSLAEAALQLNGIFEAAQNACEQYTRNIEERSRQQKEICDRMEQEAQEKCDRMVQQAQREADEYWEYVRDKVRGMYGQQHERCPQEQRENEA